MSRGPLPRRIAAVLLAALTAAASSTWSAHAAGPPSWRPDRAQADRLDRYWTARRMAAARPAEPAGTQTGDRAGRQGGPVPPSHPFPGIPQVGTFFWVDGQSVGRFCGATVVHSPHRNLVVSAAHCLVHPDPRRYLSFVPQYHDGLKPYGVFPVERIHLDPRYPALGSARAARWDYSITELGPREDGEEVEEAVGGVDLDVNTGYEHGDVRLIGYPGSSDRLYPEPLDCHSATHRFTSTDPASPGDFLRIACAGFISGTSGGPFLIRRPFGYALIGVIGGYHTGGNTPDISYSSYFTDDTLELYLKAVRGEPANAG